MPQLIQPGKTHAAVDEDDGQKLDFGEGELPLTCDPLRNRHRLSRAVQQSSAFSCISQDECDQVLQFNESGLTKKTVSSHSKAWCLWNRFLSARPECAGAPHSNPLLLGVDQRQCAVLITLWVVWMKEEALLTYQQITDTMGALKGNWTTANCPHDFVRVLSDLEADRVKKAIAPSEDEIRDRLSRAREREKFPTAPEMLRGLFESHFWELLPDYTDPAVSERMGNFLAAVLTEDTAQRGANWVGQSYPAKTLDVRFQLGVGSPVEGNFEKIEEKTGEAARVAIMQHQEANESVRELVSRIVE
eukprot:gene6514-3412_t